MVFEGATSYGHKMGEGLGYVRGKLDATTEMSRAMQWLIVHQGSPTALTGAMIGPWTVQWTMILPDDRLAVLLRRGHGERLDNELRLVIVGGAEAAALETYDEVNVQVRQGGVVRVLPFVRQR